MRPVFSIKKNLFCLTLATAVLLAWGTKYFFTFSLNDFERPGGRKSVTAPGVPQTVVGQNTLTPEDRDRITNSYLRLPLSFEENKGQTDREAKFLARGDGYSLFMTPGGAVLSLRKEASVPVQRERPSGSESAVAMDAFRLNMRLVGSNASPKISGVGALPGKSNYFLGGDPSKWHTGVASYARVKYQSVYPGIDLVYYGNQRQLEYDFILAPGADPKHITLSFEGAKNFSLDAQGELVIDTGSGEIRQHRPLAYQEVDGEKREVLSRYVISGENQAGFEIGDYDRNKPLVIDPILVYSTFLGGSNPDQLPGHDQAFGIALGTDGSAYVTGFTGSINFPTAGPLQSSNNSNASFDAFVTKINPAGSALVYSTYLGGSAEDRGNAISVDAGGNAYVTGYTSSDNFPTAAALQNTKKGSFDVFIAKLNSAGNALTYSTYLGGREPDQAFDVAIDAAGNAYVTGSTFSMDFPAANAFQQTANVALAFKSTDGGGNWAKSDAGMGGTLVNDFAVDPAHPAVVYAATNVGIFKSTDGGGNWSALDTTQTGTFINKLLFDKSNPSLLYAATFAGLFKSADGGASWSAAGSGLPSGSISSLAIDPANTATMYVVTNVGIYKSTNGGSNWAATPPVHVNQPAVRAITVDAASTVFAGTSNGIYKSTNGGNNWSLIPLLSSNVRVLIADPTIPGTIYVSPEFGGNVYKITDGGNSLSVGDLDRFVQAIAIAPTDNSILYAGGRFDKAIYKSTDGGLHWSATNTSFSTTSVQALTVSPTDANTVYAGIQSTSDAFVSKLNASGSALVYSTFVGGHESDGGADIAVDAEGDAYVTGFTSSLNFPTANPLQPAKHNGFDQDAFVFKLNQQGNSLVYSTYLGGDGTDSGLGIAIDSSKNVYLSGQTTSSDFPVTAGSFQTGLSGGNPFQFDAFVTKLNPSGTALVFSTYLGAVDGDEAAHNLAVDADANVYVTGSTASANFPVKNSLQAYMGGGSDAFVTKLNPQGSSLTYSTFLGGAFAVDTGRAIAVDAQGNAYVAGHTSAANFPTVNPLQPTKGTGSDAFIAKIGLAPDLVLILGDMPDPTTVGNNLTYTIQVTNAGEVAAHNVTINNSLPAGVNFVSAHSSQGSCTGTTTVTCNLGVLDKGASASATIVVTPIASGSLTNTASVTSTEQDANTANNSATQSTTVTQLPSISGKVTDLQGNAFVGVTVHLTGTESRTTRTDNSGNYKFSNLQLGGSYTVTPAQASFNFNPSSQSFGNLTQHQTANFASLCSYTISPINQSFPTGGGVGAITVTETGSCQWTATSNAPWITVTSGASGTGGGTVTFSVAPATQGSRSATLTVAGQTFTVWQEFNSCGSPSFVSPRTFPAEGAPVGSAVGDFNNDGRPDLVMLTDKATGGAAGSISALLNDGQGGFLAPVLSPGSSAYQVEGIAAGDFNSDGKTDLAVPLWAPSGKVLIFTGNGNGSFSSGATIDVGSHPSRVVAGDVNGDGKIDLAVVQEPGEVAILLGTGAGNFSAPIPVGSFNQTPYPTAVAVADFNSDGKADLAVTNSFNVAVFLGNGAGAFSSPSTFSPAGGNDLAVADFNNDGHKDIVVTSNNGASILLGTGTGSFGAPTTIVSDQPNPGARVYVKVADFNNDGHRDVVYINPHNSNVSLSLGNGTGNFGPVVNYALGLGGYFIEVADFNNDGKQDVASSTSVNNGVNDVPHVALFLGTGTGTLTGARTYAVMQQGAPSPVSALAGDFNNDGKTDLAVLNVIGTALNNSGAVSVLLGDGLGGLGSPSSFTVGLTPKDFVSGDFNNDGKTDLAVLNGGSNNVSILLGTGAGGFGPANNFTVGTTPRAIARGDFNNDGKADLAVTDIGANARGHISVLLGAGDGSFNSTAGHESDSFPGGITVADFNQDGRDDLVTASFTGSGPSRKITALLGNGDGTFGSGSSGAQGQPTDIGSYSLAVFDFNGDGRLDVATYLTTTVIVFYGDGRGELANPLEFDAGLEPRFIATGDFNNDGKPDLSVANWRGNNVSLLVGNGMGNFSAPVHFNVGQYPSAIAIGDFNSDNRADIAVTNFGYGNVTLLLNNCNISAQPTPTPTPTPSPTPSPTPAPTPTNTWMATVLTEAQVDINTWRQSDGNSYAKVKLTFPTAGYRVQDQNWGSAVRSGQQITADAQVEKFDGASIQTVSTTVNIYNLGPLPDGGYTFNFKTSGQLAKAINFTVSSAAPPANPIDNQREFVRWQYKDFLGREPDAAGWDVWTNNITKCNDPAQRAPGQTEAQCIDRQRETTSAAFFLSPEFQYTGYFVYRVYKGGLGRAPFFSEFIPDQALVNANIVNPITGQLSATTINQNKVNFANQFALRPEFVALYGGLTNAQYVDRLFQNTGVTPSASDRQMLIDQLNTNPSQRGDVLLKVVDGINVISEGNQQFTTTYGQAFYNQQFNPAFVQMEYFGYMRRDPDNPGYVFWLGKLNSFPSYIEAQMVRSFVVSPEYRSRFGAP